LGVCADLIAQVVEPLDHSLGDRDQVLESLDLEGECPLLALEGPFLTLECALLTRERVLDPARMRFSSGSPAIGRL
jgi:hypothetical protein